MATVQSPRLTDSLKRVAAALRDAGVPFILAGGMAVWARGGPPTDNDIDLLVRRCDQERALEAVAAAGMRVERPPEGWLVKAWDGDVLIDLITDPVGLDVDDDLLARAQRRSVEAMTMPVLSVDDVLLTRLLALNPHRVDYTSVLECARSLREQVDWEGLEERTSGSPFARTFFYLARQLGIAPGPAGKERTDDR